MDLIRGLAWLYFLLFTGVAILGLVAQFTNEGDLFGLFILDTYDNSLHFASGLWAAVAAWHSRGWAVFYFRLFGILYFFDGVVGLFVGSGYLDFGLFLYGPLDLPLMTRILANLPHIALGGFAIYAGFVLSRRPTAVAA